MSLASHSAAPGVPEPLLLQRSLRLGIGAVYGAAAVPLFFIYNILPASLRQAGQPPEVANLVFLAYLPFALRVVWAPIVARIGRNQVAIFRRIVLVCLALAIAVTASLVAFEPHTGTLGMIAIATLAIMAIATAAVALDGYLLVGFPPDARVRCAPLQGIGFAFGGLVMGVGIMLFEGAGWSGIILLLVLIDPPPLNWSTLKYVFWQTGGPRCRRNATSRKRSSRSCARSMCWSRRGNPLPMRSARSA